MNRYLPLVMMVVFGQAIIAFLLIDRVVKYRLFGPPPEELEEVTVEVSISDEPERIYRDLGTFLVNPADTLDIKGLRFLRAEVTLGVSPSNIYDQIKARNPRLRDAIISIFTARTTDEMDNPEDREFMKDEIRYAVEKIIPPSPTEILIQVYFTDFVIQ